MNPASRLFRAFAFAAGIAIPAFACSAPIVTPASLYSYQIKQVDFYDANSVIRTDIRDVHFDGVAETFSLTRFDGATRDFTVNESQTDLGGGRWQIVVSLAAQDELFSLPGQWAFFFVGGMGQDPLDVTEAVHVEHAELSLHRADHSQIASWDVGGDHPEWFANPWDGYFINSTSGAGYNNMGNAGVREVNVSFIVSNVPEPGSVALAALALAAAGLGRRRARV